MAWTPRADYEAQQASAIQLAQAVLSVRDQLTQEQRNEALGLAIWFYTQAGPASRKYNIRYRSKEALAVSDKQRLAHEHVIPKKVLVERMLAEPDRCEEIMRTAQGCVVLRSEHDLLTKAGRADPTLEGWARYRAAGITVIDCLTGEPLALD